MSTGLVSAVAPDYTAAKGAQEMSLTTSGALRVNSTDGAAISGAVALSSGVAGTAGRSILISASVAGTVTLILSDGSTVIVNPVVGDNIYPFAVTTATTGTATVSHYYNLS